MGKIKRVTQEDWILALLRSGPKTTNEIIHTPFGLAAEYRRAISNLRRRGYQITYSPGRGGSGTYTLDAEPLKVEEGGQMAFA